MEFDKCCILNPIYFTLEDAIRGEILKNADCDIIILDFVFYTNRNIITILNSCNDIDVDEVEIHRWETNRDQCLINDKIRMKRENRKYDCSKTIENALIEIPNLKYLKEIYKKISFSIYNHKVFKSSILEA